MALMWKTIKVIFKKKKEEGNFHFCCSWKGDFHLHSKDFLQFSMLNEAWACLENPRNMDCDVDNT